MYSQIDRNKRLTFVLLSFFIVLVVGLTYVISLVSFHDKYAGIFLGFVAFFISLASSLVSYFGGAAIVLAMTHAVEVSDNPSFQKLNDSVETLSIKAGIPKPKVYVLPDPALNAFATGRNPQHAHVAVTQGLLESLAPDELEAVIAHELGHVRNYDIRLMLIVSVLAGVLTTIADFFMRSLFWGHRDRDEEGSNPIMMVIAIVFAILAPIIATLVQLAISRRREFLADMSAVEITRYPEAMVRALRKLQHDDRPVAHATSGNAHMFIDFPLKDAGNFISKLFSTHPPIEDRIAAIEKL
jgi:heat shock protein HtpX